jgi:phage shock protein C
MAKRLYRSRENRVLSGVLGGLGEYFDVDPVLFRLVYVVLTVFTGVLPGVLIYIFAIIIVPEKPRIIAATTVADDTEAV